MLVVNVTLQPKILPQSDAPPLTKAESDVFSLIILQSQRKMFNYNLQKVDYGLSNELKMNRIRYFYAP